MTLSSKIIGTCSVCNHEIQDSHYYGYCDTGLECGDCGIHRCELCSGRAMYAHRVVCPFFMGSYSRGRVSTNNMFLPIEVTKILPFQFYHSINLRPKYKISVLRNSCQECKNSLEKIYGLVRIERDRRRIIGHKRRSKSL
jgi:hypothetical protein